MHSINNTGFLIMINMGGKTQCWIFGKERLKTGGKYEHFYAFRQSCDEPKKL